VIALDDALSAVTEKDTMPDVSDRVRGLTMGPDDKLYVSTDSGVIYRYTAQ
jgi:glucose/arabinose dehydrogenase